MLKASQRRSLTQLQQAREKIQTEFDNLDTELLSLVRKVRTYYANLLQIIEQITNVGHPAFFDATPEAPALHVSF